MSAVRSTSANSSARAIARRVRDSACEGHRAESLRSYLPGAAVRFEGVVSYVSVTTNIVKSS